MKISIQVFNGKDWETTEKNIFTFKDWQDMVLFAYRLSVTTNKEVRAERHGNGHYFNYSHAQNYFNSLNL